MAELPPTGGLFDDWYLRIALSPPIAEGDFCFMTIGMTGVDADGMVTRQLRMQGDNVDELGVLIASLASTYMRWRQRGLDRLLAKFNDGIMRFGVDSGR